MGAINSDGIEILDDLGWNITQVTDDNREKAVSLPVPTTVGNDPVLQCGRHY